MFLHLPYPFKLDTRSIRADTHRLEIEGEFHSYF
jgi:hypothetical protein